MINVEVNNMTDTVKVLREGAEERLASGAPIRQFYGYGTKMALKALGLWEGEEDTMNEKEKDLKEAIDKLEERDRLKSLIDTLLGGMPQDQAVAYAYGYFEAVTDRDADEMFTSGNILDILYALVKCGKDCK